MDATQSVSVYWKQIQSEEIRLVRLLPGQWFDDIRCEVFVTTFLAYDQKPVYKALSYAWGSPRALRPINLSGFPHLVTANLESALRRLRKPADVLTLWVDALCINQADNEERGFQVNLMRDIYTNAEAVVVYLGEALADSTPPISSRPSTSSTLPIYFYGDSRDDEKLDAFQKRYTSKAHGRNFQVGKLDYTFEVFCFIRFLACQDSNPVLKRDAGAEINSDYQRNLFEALRQLLRLRWWKRIWVVQEIVVPKKVTITYGTTSASWEMWVEAALVYNRRLDSPLISSLPREYNIVLKNFTQVVLDIHYMRERWRNEDPTSLLSLLRQFSGRGATDDRDKVYALLGLARDKIPILPDYSFTIPEVYQRTMLGIMEKTESLDVLIGDLGRKNRQDLPSWIPDWSAVYDDLDRRRAENVNLYSATENSKVYSKALSPRFYGCTTFVENGHLKGPFAVASYKEVINGFNSRIKNLPFDSNCLSELSVPGSYIDTVSITGEVQFSDEQFTPVIRSWEVIVADYFSDKLHCYGNGASLTEAFQRTLCADTIHITALNDASSYRRIRTDDMPMVRAWFHQDTGVDSVDTAIRAATSRRRFFITSKGYIGLGPASMCDGDRLYILLGGRTPFILRNIRGIKAAASKIFPYAEQSCHKIMGDCYAHGFMDGEATQTWKENAITCLDRIPPWLDSKRWDQLKNELKENVDWHETLKKLDHFSNTFGGICFDALPLFVHLV